MKVKDISVDILKEYENNPRFNDNAIDKVAESIKQFGFKVPIVVDRNNIIVAGHTRYKAAQQLQLDKVPCIVADDLTPEQVKSFRLADNKVSEYSTWDQEKLYIELMELETLEFNVESFGFNIQEISTTTTEDDLEQEKNFNDDNEINTDSNFNYKEQYGVIVICENEEQQEHIFNELMQQGYECKVVAT